MSFIRRFLSHDQFGFENAKSISDTIELGELDSALTKVDMSLITPDLSTKDKIFLNALKCQILTMSGKFDEAYVIALDNIEKSKTINSEFSKSIAYYSLAFVQYEQGEISKSLDSIQIACGSIPKNRLTNKKDKSNLTSNLFILEAKIHRNQGDLAKAIELLQESIKLRKNNNNLYQQAEPINILGAIYLSRGDLGSAFDYFEQCRKIYEKIGNKKQLMKIYNNIGRLLSLKGDTELSLESYQKSVEIAEELNDVAFNGILSVNMGLVQQDSGDINASLVSFLKAESIFRKIGHQLYLGITLTNIAVAYERMGKLEEAFNIYNESLTISKELGNKQEIGSIFHNMGVIYMKKGDLELAMENFQKSLLTFEEIEDRVNLCETIFNIISTYIEMDELEKANTYFEKIEKINEETSAEPIEQFYLLSKAFILKSKDRMVEKVESLKIFKQIIAKASVKHDLMIHSMLNIADLLLLELKMSGNEKVMEEIQEILDKLLLLGEEANQIPLIIEARILQSKIDILNLNMKEAQNQLNVALELSEKTDLAWLKQKIIEEESELEGQLRRVSDMIDQNATLYERVQKSKLDEYINRVLKFAKEGGFQ